MGSHDDFANVEGRRLALRRLWPAGDGPGSGRRAGTDAGPTLVFLHEALGSIAQWKDFPAALAAACGLPALIYERLGFGRSDPDPDGWAPGYLEHQAEVVLPAVLDHCGIRRPLLVGHSDGGTIALLFAAAFPDRPPACVTMAAHVLVEEVTLQGIRDAVVRWDRGEIEAPLARYHGTRTASVFRRWAEVWQSPAFRDWAMLDRLPHITCPLLVIQGEKDAYGTPDQVEQIVTLSAGPAQPLLIPGCGHSPHLQARDTVLAAVRSFVCDGPRR